MSSRSRRCCRPRDSPRPRPRRRAASSALWTERPIQAGTGPRTRRASAGDRSPAAELDAVGSERAARSGRPLTKTEASGGAARARSRRVSAVSSVRGGVRGRGRGAPTAGPAAAIAAAARAAKSSSAMTARVGDREQAGQRSHSKRWPSPRARRAAGPLGGTASGACPAGCTSAPPPRPRPPTMSEGPARGEHRAGRVRGLWRHLGAEAASPRCRRTWSRRRAPDRRRGPRAPAARRPGSSRAAPRSRSILGA